MLCAGKVFSESTKLVAIKTTGNVYSWDAVNTLNIAPKMWRELLTDEPFTKADIVVIADPSNEAWVAKHSVNAFAHVRDGKMGSSSGSADSVAAASSTALPNGGGNVRLNDSTRRILAEVDKSEGERQKRKREEDAAPSSLPRFVTTTAASSGSSSNASAPSSHTTAAGVKTSGRFGGSLTSTGLAPQTRNDALPETPADAAEKRWARVAALGKKALVRISTTQGDINCELHADLVPRTVENFLLLAARGAYTGTPFHRSIRNFMIQGGDPTGTGTGGVSAWGEPFPDEFRLPKLGHSERGVLSMANSGPNSNKAQFFITFKSCPHLNGVHSVFGRVVGGMDALRALELIPTDPATERPLQRQEITGVTCFVNPFEEVDAAAAAAVSKLDSQSIASSSSLQLTNVTPSAAARGSSASRGPSSSLSSSASLPSSSSAVLSASTSSSAAAAAAAALLSSSTSFLVLPPVGSTFTAAGSSSSSMLSLPACAADFSSSQLSGGGAAAPAPQLSGVGKYLKSGALTVGAAFGAPQGGRSGSSGAAAAAGSSRGGTAAAVAGASMNAHGGMGLVSYEDGT